MSAKNNPQGSIWHRWDPHIHIPGTILADQYTGANQLDDFCTRINNSDPPIKALGITDYYSISSYEQIVAAVAQGKLPGVELIFPNIELRFKIGTSKDQAINGHLFISPDDPNHVAETKRFLQSLTFSTGKEEYHCNREDLIKLGYEHEPSIQHDHKALETGTNQFKVDIVELIKNYRNSSWAQQNILIGVAVNSNDGTSGLQNDVSFAATRQMIERVAHIIVSGHDKQREFWLGKGKMAKKEIEATFNNCKPCVHGSDAHKNEDVGMPALNRYTWIKGDLIFESLRQICIEPEGRVFIGSNPPTNQIASNIITRVTIANTDCIAPNEIPINSGLVAVIGARGSGKTALADMIATGGHAISDQLSKTSFIKRAYDHLLDVNVTLDWKEGDATIKDIKDAIYEDYYEFPRVQYLSQQFVDQLCSSEGMTDQLMTEIEKVIFNAHPSDERLSVSNFQELLAQKAEEPREARVEQETFIAQTSASITKEIAKKSNVATLQKRGDDLQKEIDTDKVTRGKLLAKGKDSRLTYFDELSKALDTISITLEAAQAKQRSLTGLKQSVSTARTTVFPNYQTKLKETYPNTSLSRAEWNDFSVEFKGNVDGLLDNKIKEANTDIAKIKGLKVSIPEGSDNKQPLIPTDTDLNSQTFELLTQELKRVKALIGVDTENGKQYSRLSDKILKSETDLEKIKFEIADCEGAQDRITGLIQKRKEAYERTFDALLLEEEILKDLYQPIMANLNSRTGTLGKLKFTVKRQADIEAWAERGENLMDLRKAGPFKGKGALLDAANTELKRIWETGSAAGISAAIANFRDNHEQDILSHAQAERKNVAEFITWANSIAEWLYSTEHITISYGVVYDNIDIQQLSPGTRGIVLLLLYLAIDKEDDRPLIIDQPEENLDPKSIFDELVPLFTDVKNRRQIIIVTHNANLVVNTDADQVIIAKVGSHTPGKLPIMSYQSGGLENSKIRKEVCEILEGGADAFRERAKRLRVSI